MSTTVTQTRGGAPTVPAVDRTPDGKVAYPAAGASPYQYRGLDRVAEAAVEAAARDGVLRCQCPHCCKARAQRPLTGAAQ